MKDKYYTPEIEEFHVGFDYEFKDHLRDNWVPHKLGEISCFMWDDMDNVFDTLSHIGTLKDHFRVKYLDKSDIEELGWEFLSEYSDKDKEVATFTRGGWVLVYNFTLKKIFVFVRTSVKELDPFTGTKNVKVSSLEVKNKSELKRLIKNLKMGE